MGIKKTALKALDLMTTSDVAKELGVTIRSVQLWVEKGALDGWRTPGGHRRITRSSFNRFAAGKSEPKIASPDKSRLKVIVVEDDSAMLLLYRLRIESWKLPIELQLIENGWKGIICIAQNTPDLLITDLRMGEMDGFTMLKVLREMDDFSHMAIAVVTGMQAHEIEDNGGLPKGVRLYGKSPVPFWEMRELMQSLIDRKNERFES
jgi:excisionase family DNA binding protein